MARNVQIEDYNLHHAIGHGAFANVYFATSKISGARAAVKRIDKNLIRQKKLEERVNQEATIHSRLVHDNVLKVYGFDKDENYVYLIEEYCEGGDLEKYVKNLKKPMPETEARDFLVQIVRGLTYLHKHKIIHRDLKLANILLGRDRTVKIADFGLAVMLEDEAETHMTMVGTPNFMAPEIIGREGHGRQSDVWSLGIILYTILVGKPPFDAPNVQQTLSRAKQGKIPEIPPYVSSGAKDLIEKLLRENPNDRLKLEEILQHPFMTGTVAGQPIQRISPQLDSMDSGRDTMATMSSANVRTSYVSGPQHRCKLSGQGGASEAWRHGGAVEAWRQGGASEAWRQGGASEAWHVQQNGLQPHPAHTNGPVVYPVNGAVPSRSHLQDCHPIKYKARLHDSMQCSTPVPLENHVNGQPAYVSSQEPHYDSRHGSTPVPLENHVNGQHTYVPSRTPHYGSGQCSTPGPMENNMSRQHGYMSSQGQHYNSIQSSAPLPLENHVNGQPGYVNGHPGYVTSQVPQHWDVHQRSNSRGGSPVPSHPSSGSERGGLDASGSSTGSRNNKVMMAIGQDKELNVSQESEMRSTGHNTSIGTACTAPLISPRSESDEGVDSHGRSRPNLAHRKDLHGLKNMAVHPMRPLSKAQSMEHLNQAGGQRQLKVFEGQPPPQHTAAAGDPQVQLQPLNTVRLNPIRQLSRVAAMNITKDRHVVIEFFKKRKEAGQLVDRIVEVIRISQDGHQIEVYHPNGRKGCPVTSKPVSPTSPPSRYFLSNLPTKYHKKYMYASRFVNCVKTHTPKVTRYSDRAKSILMEDSPDGTFQVEFYNGAVVTQGKNCSTRIILEDGKTLTMESSDASAEVSPKVQALLHHVEELRLVSLIDEEYGEELDRQRRARDPSTTLSEFPVTKGKRPKDDNVESEPQPVSSPTSVAGPLSIPSFDGSVVSQSTVRTAARVPPGAPARLPQGAHAAAPAEVRQHRPRPRSAHPTYRSPSSSSQPGNPKPPSGRSRTTSTYRKTEVPHIGVFYEFPDYAELHENDGTVIAVHNNIAWAEVREPNGETIRYEGNESSTAMPEKIQRKFNLVQRCLDHVSRTLPQNL